MGKSSTCEKCNSEIESWKPYCTSVSCLTREVLEIKRHPKGGFLTYFTGSQFPLRAYPKDTELHYADIMKRVLLATARMALKIPLTPERLFRSTCDWMGEIYRAEYRPGVEGNRAEEDYSQAPREILRALRKTNPWGQEDWIRYLVEIWATDMAYGMRGQDAFQELNKELLEKNPRKEILRLFDLIISREVDPGGGQAQKTKTFRTLISIALRFKTFREFARDFFMELDINEIKLDTNDRYWLANKFDYNYEGRTYEERMKWKAEMDKDWIEPQKEKEKPRIGIMPPNKAFYELNRYEAEKMAEETKRLLINNWKEHQ